MPIEPGQALPPAVAGRFAAGDGTEVSSLLVLPSDPVPTVALLALAHGAGAGMRHRFLEELAAALARHGIATFRYQFPYTERGGRRPDRRPVLAETVARAVRAARTAAVDAGLPERLPLVAGGKSMGGRMTSHAAAEGLLPDVAGLVFVGFPLHPAGRPGTERADHLDRVPQPMLFLQGTRDKLADLDLLKPVLAELGPRATLHVVEGADHGFHVLKRSGRTDGEVIDELAERVGEWAEEG